MPRGQSIPLAVPRQGVRRDLPSPEIPDGFMRESRNVVPRFGEIRFRPGLQRVVATGLDKRATGGLYFRTAGGVDRVLAGTTTDWWLQSGSTWSKITGTPLSGTVDDPVRFTVFPYLGVNQVIGVNNINTPKIWDGTAATYTDLGGGPPNAAKDVCVSANRVIMGNVVESGIRSTSRLRISDFNTPIVWPGINVVDLTDTVDEIVGVNNFNRTMFTINKSKSLWVGIAQLGTFPFRFELVEERDGPVSPAAVIRQSNSHYYFGRDTRIYQFDGSQLQPGSDPIDPDLQGLFNATHQSRCFGIWNRTDDSLWWFFPSVFSQDCDTAVSYSLKTGAYHLHNYAQLLSGGWPGIDVAGLSWSDLTGSWSAIGPGTYPDWASFGGTSQEAEFLAGVNGQVYLQRFGRDDDGTPIAGFWDLPAKPHAGVDQVTTLDAIEANFRQVSTGDPISLFYTTSESDAETTPTYTFAGTHDPTLLERQNNNLTQEAAKATGRLVGVRFAVTSSQDMGYRGCVIAVYGQKVS